MNRVFSRVQLSFREGLSFSLRQKVRIIGCVTDHSEEAGIEINVKWVYLFRMIGKIESIKG